MIASRRIGWRRVCSRSFQQPCREDGRGHVDSGAPLPNSRLYVSFSPLSRRFILIELSAQPAAPRRIAVVVAGVDNVARQTTTTTIACRRARGARSYSDDLRCGGHLVAKLSQRDHERTLSFAMEPTETRCADWRNHPRAIRLTCRSRGDI